jgi:hypothetical protein
LLNKMLSKVSVFRLNRFFTDFGGFFHVAKNTNYEALKLVC